jgi:pyruvate/2-oxoglutarate dehydrogenase complex dihydrolipoamide acyltransferase (E2) component
MEAMSVVEWLKAAGDRVTKGEPLVVLETEKANVEIEAPVSGRLATIRLAKGASVMPGETLAEIADD